MVDLPPNIDLDVARCVVSAARHYSLDPRITFERIAARRGQSGEVRQTPGGEELGIYGVPAASLNQLHGSRVTREQLRDDDCLNVSVGVYLQWRTQHTVAATTARPLPILAGGAPAMSTGTAGAGKPLPRLDASAQQCVNAAAAAYRIPQAVFRAVLTTEGGWVGLKKRNTNGSYDMGPAQINTIHLPELAKSGITEDMLVGDACVNVYVAAYRLRVEIERAGEFWRGVGNYHSRTPHLHQRYLARVMKNL